jgi:hypothetical protein
MRGRVEHDLDVVEIGEDEFASALERSEAEAGPEIQEPLLRVPIKSAITFRPAKLDAGADDLECEPRLAEFPPDREAFDLREIREIAHPQAADRFIADISDQMRGGEIVPVEFFFIRAFLFRQVDGAANRHHAHDVFERSRNRDGELMRLGAPTIAVIGRPDIEGLTVRAPQHMQMRCFDPVHRRAALETQCLEKPVALDRCGTRVQIDILVERRGDFLGHQGDAAGQ